MLRPGTAEPGDDENIRVGCPHSVRSRRNGFALRQLPRQRAEEAFVEFSFGRFQLFRSFRKFRIAGPQQSLDVREMLCFLRKQAAKLSGDLGLSERLAINSVDTERAALDEPCHIAVGEPHALVRRAVCKSFIAMVVEVLEIGLGLLAAEKDIGSIGIKSGAAELDGELFEAKGMAAFLAGVAKD